MNFRHLLEKHLLARQFFDAVSQRLCEAGLDDEARLSIIEAQTPPRTSVESVSPRCTRPRKAINGISA